jgi:hypothetical protein
LTRLAGALSIILRRLGKILATINAIWIGARLLPLTISVTDRNLQSLHVCSNSAVSSVGLGAVAPFSVSVPGTGTVWSVSARVVLLHSTRLG